MAPPPKKGRRGLVLGLVGGVGGVLVAIVVVLVVIAATSESGYPPAEYALTLPKTLLDGRYELADDLSGSEGGKIEDEMDGAWGAKVTEAKVGQYSLGGDNAKGVLVLSGMYGRFKNMERTRTSMLKGAGEADGVTVTAGPEDFTQDGSPTVSCEVLTQKQSGTTLTYPVCAWADGNTAAVIAPMTAKTVTQDPSEVDLAFYAKVTLQVRSETRKAI